MNTFHIDATEAFSKENFQTYAQIKNQIKDLTERAKQMEELLLFEMKENQAQKIESNYGTFSLRTTKKYEYPEYVEKAQDKLKKLKAKAEKNGDATMTESVGLSFRGISEK